MIHKIFSIHDAAAKAYLAPFFLPEEQQAIRGFTGAVNDIEHAFGKWPKDYTLMVLGSFDDEKGTINTLQTQKPLGNGLSFVQNKHDENQIKLPLEAVKK